MERHHLLIFDDLRSNDDIIDWGYLKSLVPVERRRVFSNLDGLLYLAGKFSVLPVKDLGSRIPIYGMMCFSAVFFDCRWNATWGRRFMFFNSLTQLSASLSNISCRALLATKFINTARAFVNGNGVLRGNKKFPEGGVWPKWGSYTVRLEHSL